MIEYNKQFTVTVAATDLEEPGRIRIRGSLLNAEFPPLPEDWKWSRCIQKGEFRGKLPKRIATYYKRVHDRNLSLNMQEWIGNRVNRYSFAEKTYTLDFTKNINWSGGDFGDRGSCFWGCRSLAKEALMENDVIAVRFYRENDSGYARAFILQVEDSLIIFNAYGLDSKVIAYILATLFDYPHRREIELYINGDPDGLIWLNEDARQIGPELLSSFVTAEFEVPYRQCADCDQFYPIEDGYYDRHDRFMCEKCY